MKIKIGSKQLLFVDLTFEQEKHVEELAGKSLVISDLKTGLLVKGEKSDMFDLICALSYTYDIEVN